MSRKTARNAAMQMIYEHEAGGQGGEDTLRMVYQELRDEGIDLRRDEPNVEDTAWIQTVFSGVLKHLDELDAEIDAASEHWRVERMARVDLTILRLAAWELRYGTDVPGSVVINEAVELANQYSEPNSGRFINGILGTLLRRREDAEALETP